ncbi:tegument protein [Cricetid gammaherpesvirus 2]|uniref:Tegument protein n=1 Tax=Cricetid gammaherpesvirus 2 TaxID=1605972 RepID=E9M5P6_9GAMA|nr:tegument protein [Cricetid gammaherpesvirus 2]ADW24404.1 tegument protein [Cricetid gammaherpesvirus 2]ADW24486.1 tegument protein [Cricetid gammaherpesvirus 2]
MDIKKLTADIQTAKTELNKLKVLIHSNTAQLDINSFSEITLSNFLNSLKGLNHELFQFIREHVAFFVLFSSSFDITEQLTVPEASHTILSLLDLLQVTGEEFRACAPLELSNGYILAACRDFILNVNTSKISSLIPPLPEACLCFPCMEQLYHLVCNTVIETLPETEIALPDPRNDIFFHQWVAAAYATSTKASTKPAISLGALASDFIRSKGPFFPAYEGEESILPLRTERTTEIYLHYNGAHATQKGLPILGFSDLELLTIPENHHLMYDFIFEGVFNNITYNCTASVMDEFLNQATNLISSIKKQIIYIASDKIIPLAKIINIKEVLLLAGLSKDRVEGYSALLQSLKSKKTFPPNQPISNCITNLTHLINFSLDFFTVMMHVSPTSISHDLIQSDMRRIDALSTLKNNLEYDSQLIITSKTFHFLLPEIPQKYLSSTLQNITSPTLQTLVHSWINRQWGSSINISPPQTTVEAIKSQDTISENEIILYCRDLSPGILTYDPTIIRHHLFPKTFITYVAKPLLMDILSEKTSRNIALFHLRWMLVFATTDTPGLQIFRRPLFMLYLEMTDIIQGEGSIQSIPNILDHIKDIFKVIHPKEQNQPIPPAMITTMFNLNHGSTFISANDTLNYGISMLEALLKKLIPLAKICSLLCERTYDYDYDLEVLHINTEGTPDKLSIHAQTLLHLADNLQDQISTIISKTQSLSFDLSSEYENLINCIDIIKKCNTSKLNIIIDMAPWSKLVSGYIVVFSKIYQMLSISSKSCFSVIRSNMHFALNEHILSPQILSKISNSPNSSQNLREIIESTLQQIHDTPKPLQSRPMTTSDLALIMETFPDMMQENSKQIQELLNQKQEKQYTDSIDSKSININWDIFTQTTYKATAPACAFSIVTLNDIIALLSSNGTPGQN